ncbi:hypothetical protein BU23DRAFT_559406 [Bimuria novae-zelandiae CBS 107.79]|uniref:Acyl-CoA dehydrogenase/oxidase C-terminal n=1 Tax=Bimuria novae-zelandiae CBS 107.79 TaxID=1447943 RepID=A0A6A5UQX1_9PLEO|nr:hypothetical protein BU23DRAFT_559406 [Bimuria novae-zelandiae CBS 107.79]
MRVDQGHQFEPLPVPDVFNDDSAFRLALLRHLVEGLSDVKLQQIFANLTAFSRRCTTIHKCSSDKLCSSADEPRLRQFDAWGRRVDELITGEGWRELKRAAAQEAIVADSYELGRRWLGEKARLFAFAKILLFAPFSKLVLCPISMTDGAVRVLELYGTHEQKMFIEDLTTQDVERAWTAGQWMTERPGGSDVSRTETTARSVDAAKTQAGDEFLLDGFKWFSSATDGDMALALARTDLDLAKGSAGLSLFLVNVRDDATGKLNGIKVHRLKQKLGTQYLPTAELELDGCRAQLIGQLGEGVRTISSVLNITRLYSAAGGVAGLAYGLRLSAAFAKSRQVGPSLQLSDLSLHTHSLFRIAVLQRGLQQLFFSTVALLGKTECGTASEDEALLLRLYTPALKAFTSSRAPEGTLGLIDSFGGQGYMEDSGLGMAEMLRDLTVERIWEGTAEVLSMDIIRVLVKSNGRALHVFVENLNRRLSSLATDKDLFSAVRKLVDTFALTSQRVVASNSTNSLQGSLSDFRFARPMLDLLMALHGAVLLLEQESWSRRASSDEGLAERIRPYGGTTAPDDDLAIAQAWIEDVADIHRTLASFKCLVDETSGHRRQNRLREQAVVFTAKL